jgi:hypothetical protein
MVLAEVVHRHDYDFGTIHWWWWLLGIVVLVLLVIALVSLLRVRPVPSEPGHRLEPQPNRRAQGASTEPSPRAEIDADEYRRCNDAVRE